MIDAPGLVEGGKNIALNNLIAYVAKVSKELVVVGFTVGKAFPLVVAVSHERLLALQIKFVHHLLLKKAFIQTKLRQECLPWHRRSARRTNVSQVR